MSATSLIAKFSETEVGAVSGIANDVAAAVASEGIAALETSSVMSDLEVRPNSSVLCHLDQPVCMHGYGRVPV